MKHDTFLPALRGNMGDWEYYACLMPLSEVAARIRYADQVHKSKRLSEWIQRALDTGKRAQDIARYLRREPQHFFNSLVVAVYGGQPMWYSFSEYRATRSLGIEGDDIPEFARESVGFLGFSGSEQLFALDGQHRLAGIKAAVIATENGLGDETVSVIFVGHSATPAGQERTRRLFTVLNKTAVRVSKKDIIALDEDDVMAICVRRFVEEGPLFDSNKVLLVENNNLPATDVRSITTIGNLYDVLKILFVKILGGVEQDLRFHRPEDEEIDRYFGAAVDFFETLNATFPPLREYHRRRTDRASVVKKYRNSVGGHLLFRPIGFRIAVEVVALLVKRGGHSLERSVRLLGRLPMNLDEPPMRGVLWDDKIVNGGAAVVRDLFAYMLGCFPKEREKDLLARYRKRLDDRGAAMPTKVV